MERLLNSCKMYNVKLKFDSCFKKAKVLQRTTAQDKVVGTTL